MFASIVKLAVFSAGGISNVLLWGVQKVLTEEFFKSVLVQVVKYVGPKLAKQSTNKLDDEIVKEIIKRLERSET